jgi:subtilisin family serine protease
VDECVKDALVFALRDGQVASDAAASIEGGIAPEGGLGAVWEYLGTSGIHGASLSLLHPERAKVVHHRAQWELGVPASGSFDDVMLGVIYVLRVPSDEVVPWLENALADDPRIAYVHRPALRYPLRDQRRHTGGGNVSSDWGVRRCRFPEVWDILDVGMSERGIAIVDQGRDEGHKELRGRITVVHPPGSGGMRSPHAGSVAGIISAIRDSPREEELKGCCSANLFLYNVWKADGCFDYCAYYRALGALDCTKVSVVNLSIGGTAGDFTEAREVAACLARGVVLVAAIGNRGKGGIPEYPALHTGVVAVGGTNASDSPAAVSTRGDHMWISAPGELIWTVDGKKLYSALTGTSYAAPFVTAAVWLARRCKPSLTVGETRALLKKSVAEYTVPPDGHSADLGHGRLDMVALATALNAPPAYPD